VCGPREGQGEWRFTITDDDELPGQAGHWQ
jgi:hypothetical protein